MKLRIGLTLLIIALALSLSGCYEMGACCGYAIKSACCII